MLRSFSLLATVPHTLSDLWLCTGVSQWHNLTEMHHWCFSMTQSNRDASLAYSYFPWYTYRNTLFQKWDESIYNTGPYLFKLPSTRIFFLCVCVRARKLWLWWCFNNGIGRVTLIWHLQLSSFPPLRTSPLSHEREPAPVSVLPGPLKLIPFITEIGSGLAF